jgi:hypothetical protein
VTSKSGDVARVEIEGSHFYAKCLSVHPTYGEILTLDLQRYEEPVQSACDLTFSEFVIFPLSQALDGGRLHGQVEGHLSTITPSVMPRFKFAVRDGDGQPIYWWLWDGNTIEIASTDMNLAALPERKMTTLSELISRWM